MLINSVDSKKSTADMSTVLAKRAQTHYQLYANGQDNMEREVDSYLRRKFESSIRDIEVVHKEDLDLVWQASQPTSTYCGGHSVAIVAAVQHYLFVSC